MEKKELIGRKVKGFAFKSNEQISYVSGMSEFNGVEGEIVDYDSADDTYCVVFNDKTQYYYPASLIEQHLVPENQIDMELLDKFALAALPGLVERLSIHITAEQAAKLTYQLAKAMIEERINYEDDVILGKGEV